MIKGIIGSVVSVVVTALILFKLGINADGEPIRVDSEPDSSVPDVAHQFAPASDSPLRLEVVDSLAYDVWGAGQLEDNIMVTIAGVTQQMQTTRAQPVASSVFHIPRPGRYGYLLRVTTWFNDHESAGHSVPCSHTADSRGEVSVTADGALALYAGFDQTTGAYQVWLQ